MSHTTASASTTSRAAGDGHTPWLDLYAALLKPRLIEEKMLRLIRHNRISKWFSGYGQEAIAVGCTWALRPSDVLLPMHRNLGVWTGRGLPLDRLFCQLMGKAGGYTNGRDRTFHFGLPEKNIVGMISHLAAMLPVACGFGLGAQMGKRDRVALALVGDGATREGDFHEALNLAAVWDLPVIFVIENNGYGLSTPTDEAIRADDLADAALGYGMEAEIVDGNDLFAVIDAVARAAERGRKGEGPTLLEMKTFRMRGHEEASGTKYVPQELMDHWAQKDPVTRLRQTILAESALTMSDLAVIEKDLNVEIEAAAEFALAQPAVESTHERERADLFAPAMPAVEQQAGETKTIRYIDAVSEGLRQAMEADRRVLVMGQDVAEYGGVFKVTEGFVEQFGRERVRNTPIIESGIIGAAMGLALDGYKPVVELQYGDFISCGFNQIVNNLATTHYRWGAPVNVTLRVPYGGGIGAGPFHSQSPEAWFCHVPGLKVLVPATPADAKSLLLAAIADPNPTLVFEHKRLYRFTKGDVPVDPVPAPLGKARVARAGKDATIVTYGVGVSWASDAAEQWAKLGVDLEIIDLRTLVPWDRETVSASIQKTGRVLVLHEAARTAGFGAELAATIAEDWFGALDAPVIRIGSEDLPVPFSTSLEGPIYSAKGKLDAGIERLLAF